jgi:hypothetical protein
MYRNYSHFSTPQLAERGGFILYARALINQMTEDEYRGAFYAWVPQRLAPVVGDALGFAPQDLELGGRLERLNEFFGREAESDRGQGTVSLHLQARAEKERLLAELAARGHPNPGSEVEVMLRQRALEMIAADPGKHLAMTIPLLWRGAFASFPVLAVVLAVSLWRDRRRLLLLALPSFGLVAFYALLTDSSSRYSNVVVPIVVVCCVWAGHAGWEVLRAQLRSRARKQRAPSAV